MPPTVCVVATGTLTGLYVFFIVVVFCLHKWRNWRVKLDLTKVYAGDPKCTMVAEEGHYSGGQTNVMKASQSGRQYQRDKRAKLPWYQTDPRTGEVVVTDERLDLNQKTESEQRRELKRLSELADLSRTIVKEVPLIESAYMSAYEGFLVEENYESASKLVREGYLLDAELDELEEERLVDEVMLEKERKEAEDFEKRNPVFQVEDGEEPDTLLLMAPTDQRYAVDHSGLPIRDRHTGGTDVRYQAALIENSEMPSLVEQSEWLNDYHKKEVEEKAEARLKESCLEILARYENGKAEEMALKQLEAATPVLERAKAIADAIDCWPLNKRCRGMMKKVTALREEAQAELDAAVDLLMKSVATKDPAKIEEAIEQTKMIHDKYPALIGRWHMVGREVATEVVRRTAKEVSVMEKQKKKQMGMIADYDIGPAEMIAAVKAKDTPKVRAGLNAFVSPNVRDPDTGMALLHLAAVNFTPEVMMLLVQKKADVKMLTSEEYDVWDVASSFVRGFMKHKLKIKVPEGRVFPEDEENSINASTGGGKKMKAASGTQESLGGSKDSDKGGKEGEEKAEKSPRRSKMKRSGFFLAWNAVERSSPYEVLDVERPSTADGGRGAGGGGGLQSFVNARQGTSGMVLVGEKAESSLVRVLLERFSSSEKAGIPFAPMFEALAPAVVEMYENQASAEHLLDEATIASNLMRDYLCPLAKVKKRASEAFGSAEHGAKGRKWCELIETGAKETGGQLLSMSEVARGAFRPTAGTIMLRDQPAGHTLLTEWAEAIRDRDWLTSVEAIDWHGQEQVFIPAGPTVDSGILPCEANFFLKHAKGAGCSVIVETGVFHGSSTEFWCHYAATAEPQLRVFAIDRALPRPAETYCVKFREDNPGGVQLLEGDAYELLPRVLDQLPNEAVCLFIDGPKGAVAVRWAEALLEEYENTVKLIGFHDMHAEAKTTDYHLADLERNLARVRLERSKYKTAFTEDGWGNHVVGVMWPTRVEVDAEA
eukprot:g15804.t1